MVYTGTVARFFADRRYGFILYDDGEMFFHEMDAGSFAASPKRGDKVSFEIGQYRGRAKAFNVSPLAQGGSDELSVKEASSESR